MRIEHLGSTAVPDLPAKPILKHPHRRHAQREHAGEFVPAPMACVLSQELNQAFAAAFQNPFITNRIIKESTKGLRLRITGDRLHWDTPELQKMLKETKGLPSPESELRHWAYFIMDPPNPSYFTFYFNINTGELITETDETPRLISPSN